MQRQSAALCCPTARLLQRVLQEGHIAGAQSGTPSLSKGASNKVTYFLQGLALLPRRRRGARGRARVLYTGSFIRLLLFLLSIYLTTNSVQ